MIRCRRRTPVLGTRRVCVPKPKTQHRCQGTWPGGSRPYLLNSTTSRQTLGLAGPGAGKTDLKFAMRTSNGVPIPHRPNDSTQSRNKYRTDQDNPVARPQTNPATWHGRLRYQEMKHSTESRNIKIQEFTRDGHMRQIREFLCQSKLQTPRINQIYQADRRNSQHFAPFGRFTRSPPMCTRSFSSTQRRSGNTPSSTSCMAFPHGPRAISHVTPPGPSHSRPARSRRVPRPPTPTFTLGLPPAPRRRGGGA